MESSVPKSTGEPVSIAEEVLGDIEDIFQPKAGGLVDRHRKERAARHAAEEEAKNAAEKVEESSYKAVKVAPESPEVLAVNTVTLAPGASTMLLPLSPYRYRASIIGITTGKNVLLCKDQGAAISANGFTLPPLLPFTVFSRAQMWVYNPDAVTTVQVSVIAEIYAPEN